MVLSTIMKYIIDAQSILKVIDSGIGYIPDGKPKWDPHGLDVGKWAGVYPLGAQVGPTRKNLHFITFRMSLK